MKRQNKASPGDVSQRSEVLLNRMKNWSMEKKKEMLAVYSEWCRQLELNIGTDERSVREKAARAGVDVVALQNMGTLSTARCIEVAAILERQAAVYRSGAELKRASERGMKGLPAFAISAN